MNYSIKAINKTNGKTEHKFYQTRKARNQDGSILIGLSKEKGLQTTLENSYSAKELIIVLDFKGGN